MKDILTISNNVIEPRELYFRGIQLSDGKKYYSNIKIVNFNNTEVPGAELEIAKFIHAIVRGNYFETKTGSKPGCPIVKINIVTFTQGDNMGCTIAVCIGDYPIDIFTQGPFVDKFTIGTLWQSIPGQIYDFDHNLFHNVAQCKTGVFMGVVDDCPEITISPRERV